MYDGGSNISTPPPGSPALATAAPSASQAGAGVRAITAVGERAQEWGGGFILAVVKDGEPKVHERKVYSMMRDGMWRSFWMLTGNFADEHVSSIRDFPN
eukprot:2882174-Pyramimonas_sp.AAC.1